MSPLFVLVLFCLELFPWNQELLFYLFYSFLPSPASIIITFISITVYQSKSWHLNYNNYWFFILIWFRSREQKLFFPWNIPCHTSIKTLFPLKTTITAFSSAAFPSFSSSSTRYNMQRNFIPWKSWILVLSTFFFSHFDSARSFE